MIRSSENLENSITVLWMEVKVLPLKVRSDSRSDHGEINHQTEAGIRAELEVNQISHTTALWGDTMVNLM